MNRNCLDCFIVLRCVVALDRNLAGENEHVANVCSLLQHYKMIRCLGPNVSRTMCLSPNTLLQLLSLVLKKYECRSHPISEGILLIGFIVTLIKESMSSQQEYLKEKTASESSLSSILQCLLQLVLTHICVYFCSNALLWKTE